MIALNGLVVYQVNAAEVRKKDYSRILLVMNELKKLGKSGRSHFVMFFSGYDHMPEELHEISDVRAWIQGLVARVPHLFYYVNFDLEPHLFLWGSLGNTESSFIGERLSFDERIRRGERPENFPSITLYVRLEERFYKMMNKAIIAYCNRLGDETSKKELLEKLHRYRPEEY